MKKLIRTNLILVITGFSALMGCKSHHQDIEEKTTFEVTSPLRADTSLTKEYVCQIHSIRHIELRALERGYLQEIFVDEGEFVKAGQLLFKIMPKLYAAELQRAQAEAHFAQIEYENTRSLAESNIVAPNELAMAKAKYDKAKAEMALAQVHLDFTEIRAPFDGIINRLEVRQGSLVEEGELLTSLSDNGKMWVYFNVAEAEYLDFAWEAKKDKAMEVRLTMANGRTFPYPGVVETIEAEFNNETGNIAFRATFPNPDRLLRHGETGNILLRIPMHDALVIPQKATFEVLEKKYVYVVDADNVVKSREVTIGAAMEDVYTVTDGLTENEKILLEGLRKVRDNDKIDIEYHEPGTVIANLKVYAE